MTADPARIVPGSAGSFLDPPTYPQLSWSVETDLRKRPENRGSMSLAAAAECDYIDPAVRSRAKAMLDGWVPPPLDSTEVRAWVLQVLGYFRSCYRGPDDGKYGRGPWAAESLSIEPETDPVLNADLHAGVHHVRRFYPAFTPTADDFASARWGL